MREKTKDEQVDGPAVAAQILNRMRPADRQRIVKVLQTEHPEIAIKIEEKLFRFDDLCDVTPQGIQLLIKEVEHKDIVLSLKTASQGVKKVLFENMSERKRQVVNEDFNALPQTQISEVEEAQQRILQHLDKLRKAGLIRTEGSNDVWV